MEKLQFKLEIFEGPLDLLMHLISKNKVNIYNIPIVQITDQYFEALSQMKDMDLEVSSEFLVMAAQLVYIKSRMLLPAEKSEDEDDPRAELVERLLEYQRYKHAKTYFQEREFSARYYYFKEPDDIEPVSAPYEGTYDISDLVSAFNDILERTARRAPPPKKTFEGIVRREKVSVRDKVKYILERTNCKDGVTFVEVFEGMTSKPELVATFLALLELIKMKRVMANYNKAKKDFVIVQYDNQDWSALPDSLVD